MPEQPHRFTVRVYYEDTDFSGVVYHASYLRFLERGRTEMLRDLDIHQGAIHAGDPAARFGFAVRAMTIDFLKPARMDDLLTVESEPRTIGGASLELDQRILRGGELLVTARVRIACLAEGRPCRIPLEIRGKLAP
ncbi:MAG: tol-pal system-associated acyl-CoA thioesterase [Hyphomicrobiales bacterium]|jgi:acyl-CoA thioester hydrolase|nr:tol-pal system-associated acyl-CoA thioesterase [Hyphomicrobiales bacterium]